MNPPQARIVEGKKFMWDGRVCESEEDARAAMSAYQKDGFETLVFEDQGQYFVYSRRVPTVVVVDQQT